MTSTLKDVSLKKALEVIGATGIKCSTKEHWFVSARFTLYGEPYRLMSCDLRRHCKPGSEEIDLNALPEIAYRKDTPHAPNLWNIHDLFAAHGVRVPLSKLQYEPYNSWKRYSSPEAIRRCKSAERTLKSIPELITHP